MPPLSIVASMVACSTRVSDAWPSAVPASFHIPIGRFWLSYQAPIGPTFGLVLRMPDAVRFTPNSCAMLATALLPRTRHKSAYAVLMETAIAI